MSDNNTDPSMNAAIEAMISAGAGFENTHVATPQPGLKYNSATGEVEQTGPSVDAPIPDNGTVPEVAIANIAANMKALGEKYAAETDHDKKQVLGEQLRRADLAAQYDISRLAALSAQRQAKARAEEAASNESLALAAFANGDQARAAALKQAMLDEEARLTARTIIATRAEAIRQGRR